jgi:poly(3-hydroxybutyrate) depolymerase
MNFAGISRGVAMAVRLLLIVTALAFAAAAQAQTPPPNPALPSIPSATSVVPPPGAAAPGRSYRRPTPNQVPGQAQPGDAATRQIQNETDELYREIMRRSAPPAQR